MGTITAANAVIMFSVTGLFPSPQQLQQFAVDDIYTTDDVQTTEVQMGVDGHLTAGYVNVPVNQNFALMADSPSNGMFEDWATAMKLAQDVFYANATVTLTSIGKKFTCTRGSLVRYKPLPDAAKVLQSRRFAVTWESVLPVNV